MTFKGGDKVIILENGSKYYGKVAEVLYTEGDKATVKIDGSAIRYWKVDLIHEDGNKYIQPPTEEQLEMALKIKHYGKGVSHQQTDFENKALEKEANYILKHWDRGCDEGVKYFANFIMQDTTDDDKLATEVSVNNGKGFVKIVAPEGLLIGEVTTFGDSIIVEYVKKKELGR